MLSIWPVLWRLVALLFDQLLVTCQQPFTWRSRLRWLWQVFSSFLIPVGGIFTAYFASPDNWIYLQREVHEEWYSGLRPVPVLSTQLPQSVVRFKLMSQLLIAWLSMIVYVWMYYPESLLTFKFLLIVSEQTGRKYTLRSRAK